jgi:hypothetical protein
MLQNKPRRARKLFSALAFLVGFFCVLSVRAQTNQTVYTDLLQNGWENWSWATVNLNNASPARGGAASASVNAGAWQAFYLHRTAFSTVGYASLNFWIHGGTAGGQRLQVQATVGGAAQTAVVLPNLAANSWQQISIPLASLGVASANIDGFWIQDSSGTTQPVFYVDDIVLVAGSTSPPPTSGAVKIAVDANLNRRAINPQIYGVAHATTAQLLELNAPLNRSGGNNTSRYNWQQNADNRGSDFYLKAFRSLISRAKSAIRLYKIPKTQTPSRC